MKMSKRRFFFLVNMIPRVRADQGLSQLKLMLTAQSSSKEGVEATIKELQDEMGIIFEDRPIKPDTLVIEDENTLDPTFDRAALRALKIKHGV